MGAELRKLFEPLLNEKGQSEDAVTENWKKIDALLEENKEALSDLAIRYLARNDGLMERLVIKNLGNELTEQGIPVYVGYVGKLLGDLQNEDLITIHRSEYAYGEKDNFVSLTPKANLREDVQQIKSEIKYEKDRDVVEGILEMTENYGLTPKSGSVDELIPLIEENYLRILTEEGVELSYWARGKKPSLKTIKVIDV